MNLQNLVKYLLFPFQWIWRAFFFINAVVTFFIFFPLFFIFLMREKWFVYVFLLKKVWGHFMLWIPLIFYSVDRKNCKLDKGKAYVFCPNHTSYLDIFLIYICIPNYFHTMGKAELKKVPLFRRFFHRMNIPVDRKSRIDSHRAFHRAASDLEKGISVALFPEGTIHHNGPHMGRFKNGPFRLAIENQVPIVPITFMNNWLLLPDDFQREIGHPGVAKVIMHAPIPTKGMTENDLEKLKAKVYQVIDAPLREKYPEAFTGN